MRQIRIPNLSGEVDKMPNAPQQDGDFEKKDRRMEF
jgi:hypothetical protein